MTIKNDFGIFWAVLNQKSTLFCKDAFFKYIQFYSPTRCSLQLGMCYDIRIVKVDRFLFPLSMLLLLA